MIPKGRFKHKNKDVSKKSQSDMITTFAFKEHGDGIDIKIIGCFQIKQAPNQPFYSKGIITVQGRPFSVFDLQALAGMKAKKVSPESCIILLDSDDDYNFFSRAIIVDDVTEMLNIANRSMAGVNIENLFGSQLQITRKDTSPDFPEITDDVNSDLEPNDHSHNTSAYA